MTDAFRSLLAQTMDPKQVQDVAGVLEELVAAGWRVEPPKATDSSGIEAATEDVQAILQQVRDPSPVLGQLLALWQGRDAELWAEHVELFQTLGNRLLKLGEPLLAYDVVSEGIERFPQNERLTQLTALALARSGAPERAEELIDQLAARGSLDEETLGLKARVHKDRWSQSHDSAERQQQLKLACEAYGEAYRRTGGYWTGINVATMSLLLGRESDARKCASRVRRQCLKELESPDGGDLYWPLATLGEAALVLGDVEEAEKQYCRAAEAGRGRTGDLSSTLRNARLLIHQLGLDPAPIEQALQLPTVVVFSGHMVDRPDRIQPRFPPQLETAVKAEIFRRLELTQAGIGYVSAACGADILFAEVLLERGGELHIVLPYASQQFLPDSVDIIPGADWVSRYHRVLEQATDVTVASPQRFQGAASFEYANQLLQGLGSLKAQQLETRSTLMVVWDGKGGDGPGGTQSMVDGWKRLGREVEWIDMAALLREKAPKLAERTAASRSPGPPASGPAGDGPEFEAQIRAILFADLVGFSKLEEGELPAFVRHFLGEVSDLVQGSSFSPEIKKTWGDGLYFTFPEVRSSGLFALELRDLVRRIDWTEKGLPAELSLRIGLHVGPVYRCLDPVTQQENYFGTHVSRTARIEPITPPGRVYASEAFAALSAAQPDPGFRCEYVGQTPLAKGFGTFPTFHVRRA